MTLKKLYQLANDFISLELQKEKKLGKESRRKQEIIVEFLDFVDRKNGENSV